MRVAIVTGKFPEPSQTWIAYHAANLLKRNVEVTIFVRSTPNRSVRMAPVDDHDLMSRAVNIAARGGFVARSGRTVGAALSGNLDARGLLR